MRKPLLLIVEDEAPIALMLEARLRSAGYEVLALCPTAAAALAAAERARPDLALTDVRIVGDVDGIDTALELRRRFEVPSVFLTAHADDRTLERALTAQPLGYLTKPFRDAELLATVQLALQRVALERDLRFHERQLAEAHRVGRLGAWQWDLATSTVTASDELLEILGVPADWLSPPRRLIERVHPDDRETVTAVLGGLVSSGAPRRSFAYRFTRADGGVRHIRAWVEVQRDEQGKPVRVAGISQDVTEEVSARAAVQASEQRFVTLFESSPDTHLVVDERGVIRLANHAAYGLFGYARDELVGMSIETLVPEALQHRHRSHRAVFHEGEPHRMFRGPVEARAKDGTTLFVEVGLSPTTLDGETMVMAAVRDVGARMQAEQALARSEARFRALFEQAGVGIAELEAHTGTLRRINPRFAEIFGYDERALVDKPLAALTHPNEASRCHSALAELQAKGARRVELETQCQHRDGSTLWIQASLAALSPGDTVVAVVQDVTARRRAEEQRREAESSLARVTTDLQAMLAAVPDLLFRVDADGTVLDFRSGRTPPRGFPRRIVGSHTRELFPPEVATRMHRAVRDAVTRRAAVSLDYEIGGDAFEGRVVPAGDREALMIVRDITEQRASQRALHEAEERLHQAQKLDAIGRLAGGIAHDFNNMLSIVLGTAPLLEPLVQEEGRELLQEMIDASRRASLLTNRLLSFARKRPAEPRVIAFDEQIDSFAQLLRRTLREDIELVLDLGATGCAVRIDPSQLEQVLLNLAVNARDAMPHGGHITITTGTVRGGKFDQPALHLQVQDTGAGMTPEVRARLFEPFFTTKEIGAGTGLGLATVYGIIRQAGGSVEVQSAQDEGSTFDIYLPLTDERPGPISDAAPALFESRGERILVVEDDPAVRVVTARVLRHAHYEVVEANDGIEALSLLRSGTRVSLVVSDVIMPRMGGRALAAALREEPDAPPVLFLTGHADGSLADLGVEVNKPFLPETLLRAVSVALDSAR